MALGELFTAANVLVDPDREPATLSIDGIAAGSAPISLAFEITEHTTRLTDLLTTDVTSTLRVLQEVVIGPAGVLDLARRMASRDVVDRAPGETGVVRVALADGTVVDARAGAAAYHSWTAPSNTSTGPHDLLRGGVAGPPRLAGAGDDSAVGDVLKGTS